MTTKRAQKIYDAWGQEFVKSYNPFYEERALAVAFKELIN